MTDSRSVSVVRRTLPWRTKNERGGGMHARTAAVAAGDGRQKFQTPILGRPSTELDTSGAAFGADSGPSSGGEPDLLGSVGGVISIQPEPSGPLTTGPRSRRVMHRAICRYRSLPASWHSDRWQNVLPLNRCQRLAAKNIVNHPVDPPHPFDDLARHGR